MDQNKPKKPSIVEPSDKLFAIEAVYGAGHTQAFDRMMNTATAGLDAEQPNIINLKDLASKIDAQQSATPAPTIDPVTPSVRKPKSQG